MATDSHSTPAQDLVALHEKLHNEIQVLNVWLKEADEYGRPQFGQLGDRVRAIRDVVARHFAEEEEGGYMAAPVAAAPHLADRAGKLLADLPDCSRSSTDSATHSASARRSTPTGATRTETFNRRLSTWQRTSTTKTNSYEAFETDEATVD